MCEELPAEVCRQCGERYFSTEVSEKIDRFLERYRREKPSRYLPTPVYSKEQRSVRCAHVYPACTSPFFVRMAHATALAEG